MILVYVFYIGWLEREQTYSTAERETRLLAVTAQTAIEHAQRHDAAEDMLDTVQKMDHAYPGLDVMVLDESAALVLHSAGSDYIPDEVERGEVERLVKTLKQEQLNELFEIITLNDQHMALYVSPLRSDHVHLSGYLAIVQPVDYVEDGLRQVRYLSILVMVALMVLNMMLGGLVGRAYILRPLARLSENFERLGRGEEVLLPTQAEDELGLIQTRFVEMAGELRKTQQRLHAELEDKRVLQLALQDRERMTAIGQVTATLAHEIGSPLQVLMGRTQELRGCVGGSEVAVQKIDQIETQLARIERTIRSTLSITRHAADPKRPISLYEPVSLITQLMRGEIEKQGVVLHEALDEELPAVEACADQIQQVAFNLISNGMDWTKQGDRIEVALEHAMLEDILGELHPAVCLRVQDTGAGMDEDAQAKIFELFYTGRPERGGTGLGMPIVRQLVREHKGRITIESVEHEGTTVRVMFPVIEEKG